MECALIIKHLIFFDQLYMNQTVINHNVTYTVTYCPFLQGAAAYIIELLRVVYNRVNKQDCQCHNGLYNEY